MYLNYVCEDGKMTLSEGTCHTSLMTCVQALEPTRFFDIHMPTVAGTQKNIQQ